MKSLKDTWTLKNGNKIPCVGFGTWQTPDGQTATDAVKAAIELGYRHIDAAAAYFNEEGVGKGIRESGVPREELFVTSKLWNDDHGYESTIAACEASLKRLGLDYLDLYLIHWPIPKGHLDDWKEATMATWRAFEKLYQDGKVRAIGLSNFLPKHMEHIMAQAQVQPMVSQIEFHPGYMQAEAVKFYKEHGILVEAWSPLGSGRIFENPFMKEMAEKYGKSVAQICIRWCLQHEVLPLPKSVHQDRIANNADVFGFEISAEDMARIDAMPETGYSGMHPDTCHM